MEDKMSLTSVDAPSQLSIASINNYIKTNTEDTVVSPLMSTSSTTGTTDDANNAEQQSTIDHFGEQHKKNHQIARVPTNKKTEGGDSCSCQTYSELHKTFMAELQFMLQEFKKLEQQLLWNGGATTKKKQLSEQDTVAQNNRRHKLQAFLQQLMDIIRELEVNQNILSDSPSTNDNYLSAVHKLECHIRTSILPVKARLLKQLSAQQQQQQQNHHHLRSTTTVYGQQIKFNSAPVAFANQNNLKTMNRLLRGAAPSKLTQNLYGASPSIMNNEKVTITADETRATPGTSTETTNNLSLASDVTSTKLSSQDAVITSPSITKTTIQNNKSPSQTSLIQAPAVASADIMEETNTSTSTTNYEANNNQVNAVPLPSLTDPVTTKEWGGHDKSQNSTSINSVIPASNVQTASLPPSGVTQVEKNHMLTDTTTILAAPAPVPAPAANDNLTEKSKLVHSYGLEQQHVSKLPTFEEGKQLQKSNAETTLSSNILQLKNKKKKRKKKRKHAIHDVVALLNHPKRHHHHIISYIDESSKNLQTAFSCSSKNPLSSGATAAIKGHHSSHHVVMDRCIELTCASCNEIYTVSINSSGGKNNNIAAATSNKYYNPWWSLRREACPKCNQIQIPRIDISAPANYLEYHPALLAHINIDQGNRTSTRSISPPCLPPYTTSITGTTSNDFSSSLLFGPSMQNSNSQPASHPPSSKLDSIHPMEESSAGSCDEECSENDSDELDSSSICEALHLYENEDYGKNYSGPKLQDTDAARLLILFNHARNCPGRHLNTKHNQVCQSVKYIMLHVRDCSGSMNVPNVNETIQKAHDENNLEIEQEKRPQDRISQGNTARSATIEKDLIANNATAGADLPPQGNRMTTASDQEMVLQDKTAVGNDTMIQNAEEDRDFSKDSSFSPVATSPSLITVPCPFPWCRPVKNLLYHLLRCTAGKQCRICHPRCISDNFATLSSLNAQWKNKANANTKAPEGTPNEENLDASAKVEMMLCVKSMLAAAGNDSIPQIDTKRCTTHPGDHSILTNDEFMMKTSESFLLPHTFPSLPDDLMRVESSVALLAEVGKEGNRSTDNVADGLSLNEDRWEENQFSRAEVHSSDPTVRQQTPWSSCTDELISNLGESNNISLVIPVDANDSAG